MKGLLFPSPRFAIFRWSLFILLLGALHLPAKTKAAKMLDIADSIAVNRITTQFAAMLQSSEMATFLSSRGPFTVFLPTDSAFSKLPPETLAALLRPENKERLQDIVLFHVVSGKAWTSKDLQTATSLLSCEGTPSSPLTIHKTKGGTQLVMKAKIIHADIKCQNGTIHEIDTVLMPPEKSLPPLVLTPPPAPATNAPAATPPVDTNAVPVPPATPVN
jgi:uncharacterized surface protein with fasciclin (FAS1) repeats